MSELIRTLNEDEQGRKYVDCCSIWGDETSCVRLPTFRLATPHGEMDFCPDHIGYAIASLPPEWLDGFAYRERVLVAGSESDDIPF